MPNLKRADWKRVEDRLVEASEAYRRGGGEVVTGTFWTMRGGKKCLCPVAALTGDPNRSMDQDAELLGVTRDQLWEVVHGIDGRGATRSPARAVGRRVRERLGFGVAP